MASTLGRLVVDLIAKTGGFETDMGRAARTAEKRMKEIERSVKAGAAVIGAAVAAGAASVTIAVKHAIDTADELAKTSQKIGVTVEALSTLEYAAAQSGVSLQKLQGGLVKLSKTASDAAAGSATAAAGFDAIGVSVTDASGKLKGTDQLLKEVAAKMGTYGDSSQKTALAVQLFGRSGAELIPLLSEGASGIEELQKRAQSLGLEISGNTARQAEQFNDLMSDMGRLAQGFSNDLARELLPALAGLAHVFVENGIEGRNAAGGATVFADGIKAVIGVTIAAVAQIQKLGAMAGAVAMQIETIGQSITTQFGAISQFKKDVLDIGPIDAYTKLVKTQFAGAGAAIDRARGNLDALSDSFDDIDDDAARKIAALNTQFKETAEAISGPDGAAPAIRDLAAARAEDSKAIAEQSKRQSAYLKLMADSDREQREWVARQRAAAAAQREHFGRQEQDIRNEIMLLGLSGAARSQLAIQLQAENMARDQNGNVVLEQAARYEVLLGQLERQRESAAVAAQFEGMWTSAIGNVGAAFGDLITGQIKSWKDFGRQLVSIAKRFVADIIAEMAKAAIVKWLTGQGGGAMGALSAALGAVGMGASGSASASGGGGGIGNYTSLLSGSSTALQWGGSAAAAAPWAMPAAGALAGAYYGAQNRPNMGSRIAAGAAYGYAGYALGTVATGALIGAGAGAATGVAGAAAGGAMAGASGAAMAIPVIGWIIAVMALIDMASGGKLFGTKFNTRGAEQNFGVGPDGGTASLTLQQERQRSLFRGIARRNVDQAATPEMRQAADELYRQNRQIVEGVSRQLMGDVDGLLEGALRVVQRYSKKGKLESTKHFVDILGRSWEEASMELAQTRLGAEQMIWAIDQIMGVQVPAIASAVADGIGGAIAGRAGDIGSRIGEIVGVAMNDGLDEIGPIAGPGGSGAMTGEASRIAERWRSDAELLMQGAQTLLVIATDMRNGFDLLGTGTLTPIIELVEDLAYSGESMLDTYSRLAQSTQLYEHIVDMLGATLDLGREAFVRFSNDFVEAAGGIQQAGQMWQQFEQSYFTPIERAQRSVARAQVGAAGAFEGIGLDIGNFTGPGGMAAFRTLFEEVFPTLSADAQVAWINAGNALAYLTGITGEYNQLLAQQPNAMAQIRAEMERIAGIRNTLSGLGEETGLVQVSERTRRTREIEASVSAALESLHALGAGEAELAEARQIGADAIVAMAEALNKEINDLLLDVEIDLGISGLTETEIAQLRVNAQFDKYREQLVLLGASVEQLTRLETARGVALTNAANSTNQATTAIRDFGQSIGEIVLQIQDRMAGIRRMMGDARMLVMGDGLDAKQREIMQLQAQFAEYRRQILEAMPSARQRDAAGGWAHVGGRSYVEELEAAMAELDTLLAQGIGNIEARYLRELQDEIDRRYQAEMRWIERLVGLRDSLFLDPSVTTATPAERMAEARRQYDSLYARVAGGDENARGDFESAARNFLGIAREFYGSSADYTSIFNAVRANLDTLIAASPAAQAQQAADTAIALATAHIAENSASTVEHLINRQDQAEEHTVALLEQLRAAVERLDFVEENTSRAARATETMAADRPRATR